MKAFGSMLISQWYQLVQDCPLRRMPSGIVVSWFAGGASRTQKLAEFHVMNDDAL
jgi:hypothetical protein